MERMRACRLYGYELGPTSFELTNLVPGFLVARQEVSAVSLVPVGDLLQRHVEAGIELRIVRNLWPLIDAILASGLKFSIIRRANAQRRLPL